MKLKDFFEKKIYRKWDKSQWMILVLAGALLMVIAIPTEDKKRGEVQKAETNEKAEVTKNEDYTGELEKKLSKALSKVSGAGRVEVMITLEDSGESVVEKDTAQESSDLEETDDAGGRRTQHDAQRSQETVYEEEGNGKTPFIGKERMPKIAGVLVIAEGGENTVVKQNISEAVMALFQIDVNRIKVVKMKMQEEGS